MKGFFFLLKDTPMIHAADKEWGPWGWLHSRGNRPGLEPTVEWSSPQVGFP